MGADKQNLFKIKYCSWQGRATYALIHRFFFPGWQAWLFKNLPFAFLPPLLTEFKVHSSGGNARPTLWRTNGWGSHRAHSRTYNWKWTQSNCPLNLYTHRLKQLSDLIGEGLGCFLCGGWWLIQKVNGQSPKSKFSGIPRHKWNHTLPKAQGPLQRRGRKAVGARQCLLVRAGLKHPLTHGNSTEPSQSQVPIPTWGATDNW